jgi:uncharacterized membrane protein YhaH (DUF805 family)
MNPVEAITACLTKYATFSGRSSRSEFWWFYLFYIMIVIVGSLALGGSPVTDLIYLVLLIPLVAAGVRRMHDTDHSGWWYLVPIMNLVFDWTEGTNGPNQYGEAT